MSEPPHESTDQLVPMTVVYVYTYMVGQPTVSSVRTKKSHIFTRAILSLFLEKKSTHIDSHKRWLGKLGGSFSLRGGWYLLPHRALCSQWQCTFFCGWMVACHWLNNWLYRKIGNGSPDKTLEWSWAERFRGYLSSWNKFLLRWSSWEIFKKVQLQLWSHCRNHRDYFLSSSDFSVNFCCQVRKKNPGSHRPVIFFRKTNYTFSRFPNNFKMPVLRVVFAAFQQPSRGTDVSFVCL